MPYLEIPDSMYDDLLMLANEKGIEINEYIYSVLQTPIDYHYNKWKDDEKCGNCNQTLTYDIHFESRYVRFLMALVELSRAKQEEYIKYGGDKSDEFHKYIHYNQIKKAVNHFFGVGDDLTGYSMMGKPPYLLIKKFDKKKITHRTPEGNPKTKGLWYLTDKGFAFLKGQIKIPLIVRKLKGSEEVKYGEMSDIYNIPEFNYQESCEILKENKLNWKP